LDQLKLTDLAVDGEEMWRSARKLAKNVAMFLPRNLETKSVRMVAKNERVEIECNYLNDQLKAVTCYWGGWVCKY
jgi:trimethylguanosine synthase